jgi:hypothetical protein
MDEFADVVMIKFEVFQFKEVFDIPEIAGDEIVHADDMVSFPDEAVTEVGPQESCCTGDQYALFAHGLDELLFVLLGGV